MNKLWVKDIIKTLKHYIIYQEKKSSQQIISNKRRDAIKTKVRLILIQKIIILIII